MFVFHNTGGRAAVSLFGIKHCISVICIKSQIWIVKYVHLNHFQDDGGLRRYLTQLNWWRYRLTNLELICNI